MRSSSCLLALSALLAACSPAGDRAITLVTDDANLLAAAQRERIATFHALLLDDYDIDYRVVTTADAADIDVP